jgi:hypothetical protein
MWLILDKKEDVMKKLLTLFLVLSVASAASALPIIVGSDEIDISVGYVTLTLQGTSAEASSDNYSPNIGGYEGVIWIDYSAYSYQLSDIVRPRTLWVVWLILM